MAERTRALTACASACVLIVAAAPARADPSAVAPDPPNVAPSQFPSVGRFEIVQGVGRNPPLMLDTANGTTWSMIPTGRPNDFGWVRVPVMDASAAAVRSPDHGSDPDHYWRRRHSSAGYGVPPPHG